MKLLLALCFIIIACTCMSYGSALTNSKFSLYVHVVSRQKPNVMESNVSIDLQFLHDVVRANLGKSPKEGTEIVFNAMCQQYSLDLVNSDRLHASIKRYLYKPKGFVQRVKNSLKGGKQVRLHREWLSKARVWNMKILHTEYVKSTLVKKIQILKKENNKLKKVAKTHEKCKDTKKKLNAIKNKYKERAKRLSLLLHKREVGMKGSVWKRKVEYSERHARRLKKKLQGDFQTRLMFLERMGIEVKTMMVKHKDTKQIETIQFIDDPQEVTECSQDELLQRLNLAILVKDAHCISDPAWRALSSICNLPNLNQVKRQMPQSESEIPLVKTKSDKPGVQRDLEALLKHEIKHAVKKGVVGDDNQIDVKISGDGTIVGQWHYVNVTCTLLNDENNACSPHSHHPIAIICDEEKYDKLKEHLVDIIEQIASLHELEIDGTVYRIRYFLCGDYKFLLMVCGLGAANSKFPCIYCLADSAHLHSDTPHSQRVLGQKTHSCSRDPIFKSISLEFIVIDTLHMYLRITDRFMDKVMQMCNELDMRNVRSKCTSFDRDKMKACVDMECILSRAGVRGSPISFDQEKKKVKCRDLRGPEKKKLEVFLHEIENVVKDHAHGKVVVRGWKEFCRLHEHVRSFRRDESEDPSRPAVLAKLRDDLQVWVRHIVEVCTSKFVTPYMHLFVKHTVDTIEKHGSIHIFNAQGLEKLNDLTTIEYFSGTNHHKGIASLSQIMQRSNRRLYRTHHNIKLPSKRRCSKCHQISGHNRLTCPVIKPTQFAL